MSDFDAFAMSSHSGVLTAATRFVSRHEEEMAAKNLLSLSPVLLGRPRAYSHMEPLQTLSAMATLELPAAMASMERKGVRTALHAKFPPFPEAAGALDGAGKFAGRHSAMTSVPSSPYSTASNGAASVPSGLDLGKRMLASPGSVDDGAVPVVAAAPADGTYDANEKGACPDFLCPQFADVYNKDGRIGIYPRRERDILLRKFMAKRNRRLWRKKIRYACRKNLADKRLRIKGRFVKADSEEARAYFAEQAQRGMEDGRRSPDACSSPTDELEAGRPRSQSMFW